VVLDEGGAAEVTVDVAGLFGEDDEILLSLEEAPVGLVWSFSAESVFPGEAFTLTLEDTELLSGGEYTLRIVGEGGWNIVELGLPLTVAKTDFGMRAVEPPWQMAVDRTAVFAFDVTAYLGWTEPVTLTLDVDSLPPGVAVALVEEPEMSLAGVDEIVVTPPARVYLLVTVAADVPPRLYTIRVVGEAADRQRVADLALDVYPLFRVYVPNVLKE